MNTNELKKRYADGEQNFTAADLSGASLNWINLSGANLSRTDFYGAQLSGANLSQANLSAANLSGADLSRADLSGANLEGADLQGANLNNTNLTAAVYNQLTKFPQGFEPSKIGMLNSEQIKEQAAQTTSPPVVLADRTSTPTEDLNRTVVNSLGAHQVYQTTPFENSIPIPKLESAFTEQVPFPNPTAYGSSNSTPTATGSKGSEDLKKLTIAGSVIGAAIIIGFLITKNFQSTHQNNQIITKNNASEQPAQSVTIQTSPPQLRGNIMIGDWEGSFGLNSQESSTISITSESGQTFQGTLYTVGNKGGKFRIAIEGEINLNSRLVTIREVEILSKPSEESWFLGMNTGTVSSDFRQISGTGKDPRGNKYTWSFYRK